MRKNAISKNQLLSINLNESKHLSLFILLQMDIRMNMENKKRQGVQLQYDND